MHKVAAETSTGVVTGQSVRHVGKHQDLEVGCGRRKGRGAREGLRLPHAQRGLGDLCWYRHWTERQAHRYASGSRGGVGERERECGTGGRGGGRGTSSPYSTWPWKRPLRSSLDGA